MALQPVDLSTPENVFAVAATDFRAGLSEDQRNAYRIFDDPCEMIQDLQEHIKRHSKGKRSRLLAACSKIESFRLKIEPYFRVVDIVVSSHPEYAAIVWGAIQLIFSLSQHYVSFFEKLAAMLGEITARLPLYGKHLVNLRHHACAIAKDANEELKWRDTLMCLSKSLAYVYADILQFCNDVRNLFPVKYQGIRHKARIIQDLFWTPFDKRFTRTLERLKEHGYLFERELNHVYNEDVLSQHEKIDREIQKNSLRQQEMDDERGARQGHEFNDKVKQLKHWIAAPDWTRSHDEAERRRLEESGKWFIEHSIYRSWARSTVEDEDPETSIAPPVLVISGKPGYGKTILCSQAIEDLQNLIAATSSSSSVGPGLVVYFYFTNLQNESRLGGGAFRAVLTQILQARRSDPDFIDIGSLLYDNGKGQNRASDKEVRDIVHLFLNRLGPSVLVFDGIDECSDIEDFLLSINDILLESSCKILIFTRPITEIPGPIGHRKFHHIILENEKNFGDIEIYLRMRIAKLVEGNAIAGDLVLDGVVAQLCRRANSMFLWAVLMSNYLSSPYLTPKERLDAIYQLNRFEGLDAMYSRILEEIHRRLPERQLPKVTRIFQWLAVARRPLRLEALRAGLAVQQDRPATSFDFIQNFGNVLPQLCGSLVETRGDGTVDFIHVSVLEYLTQRDEGRHRVLKPFSIGFQSAEVSMTVLCLSHLTYEVPNGPLTSSSAFTPQRDVVETQLPLLDYVAECWPWHAGRSFMLLGPSGSFAPLHTMITAIKVFIKNKIPVTTWIEALFLFRQVPNLTTLVSNVTLFCDRLVPSSATEALQLADTLERFSTQLGILYERWHKTLVSQPNEIWCPSIQAWSQCEFIFDENLATVTPLSSENERDWILVSSQVSSDSTEVGMLKVLPPAPSSSVHQSMATPGQAKGPKDGWKAAYEIWSLETLNIISRNEFSILREIPQHQSERFQMPVAFSQSLRSIVVEDTVFRITDELSGTQSLQIYSQVLPASGCRHEKRSKTVQRNWRETSMHIRHSAPNHACYEWFYYIFSPSSQYLAALEGDNFGISGSWVLTLYEEPFPSTSKPFFVPVASIYLSFSPLITMSCHEGAQAVRKQNLVCFHPFEPVIAFCPDDTVAIWKFTVEGSEPLKVYSQSLLNLGFSSCGEYLHGKNGNNNTLEILNVASMVHSPGLTASESVLTQAHGAHVNLEGPESRAVGRRQIDRNSSTTINSQQSIISKANGQVRMLSLDKDHNTNSIILTAQNGDQNLLQGSLARIPESLTLQNSFATLAKSQDQDHLRLVLNKIPQMSYSFSSKPDVCLPLVFDRQKNTITMEKKTLAYRLEHGGKRSVEDYSEDAPNDEETNGVRKRSCSRRSV